MGLTIHWSLKLPRGADALEILNILRTEALKLPVAEVSQLFDFAGCKANYMASPDDDPTIWLKMQAARHMPDRRDRRISHIVPPTQFVALSVWPGAGCEEANFGFALYPRCKVWRWRSFCKTQYANEHGIEHFLKCHLSVIHLLDALKALGCLERVSDEGKYWQCRDIAALVKEIGEWDQFIAAFGGQLKDAVGKVGLSMTSPIFNRKDFEQLEFRGLQAKERGKQ